MNKDIKGLAIHETNEEIDYGLRELGKSFIFHHKISLTYVFVFIVLIILQGLIIIVTKDIEIAGMFFIVLFGMFYLGHSLMKDLKLIRAGNLLLRKELKNKRAVKK